MVSLPERFKFCQLTPFAYTSFTKKAPTQKPKKILGKTSSEADLKKHSSPPVGVSSVTKMHAPKAEGLLMCQSLCDLNMECNSVMYKPGIMSGKCNLLKTKYTETSTVTDLKIATMDAFWYSGRAVFL